MYDSKDTRQTSVRIRSSRAYGRLVKAVKTVALQAADESSIPSSTTITIVSRLIDAFMRLENRDILRSCSSVG